MTGSGSEYESTSGRVLGSTSTTHNTFSVDSFSFKYNPTFRTIDAVGVFVIPFLAFCSGVMHGESRMIEWRSRECFCRYENEGEDSDIGRFRFIERSAQQVSLASQSCVVKSHYE
jgi:hypothetical protein